MPEQIINYIHLYGYIVLFCLVFLQEIGVPGFSNEIVLYYFGFLCSQNTFSLPIVLSIAILADIIGTLLLYFLFYYFGSFLVKIKPAWIKISTKKLDSFKANTNYRLIFFGRITPFIRGYISVFAGIAQTSFILYFKQIFLSAILFTGGFVLLGWATGKYWKHIFLSKEFSQQFLILFFGIVVCIFIFKKLIKVFFEKQKNAIKNLN